MFQKCIGQIPRKKVTAKNVWLTGEHNRKEKLSAGWLFWLTHKIIFATWNWSNLIGTRLVVLVQVVYRHDTRPFPQSYKKVKGWLRQTTLYIAWFPADTTLQCHALDNETAEVFEEFEDIMFMSQKNYYFWLATTTNAIWHQLSELFCHQ